jgi:GT2 family glycosyltransferase
MVVQRTVDVIIPVYNQLDCVKTCVESVIKASVFNEYEIIVIDDASTESGVTEYLQAKDRGGLITLFRNELNLGFTGTVNFGMGLHSDRDVLLLNSDTYVHSSWAERMRRAAYSDRDIATVSPLTNASHISNYPNRGSNDGIALEVTDDVLDDLAADSNRGRYIDVHTNVGFCMFIKRESLDSVGLFDRVNFPVGYGEESDFCYRTRKLGWRHVVAGDVFVRHFEGQSFGERKRQLMQEMFGRFDRLHPECGRLDERFTRLDPLRGLRANMDLARIRRLVQPGNAIKLYVIRDHSEIAGIRDAVALLYFVDGQYMQLATRDSRIFPNLERYIVPRDTVKFNAAMEYIDVNTILCASEAELSLIKQRVSAKRDEIDFGPTLALAKTFEGVGSGA